MTELRKNLARTIAFEGRGRHDVSRDADHFWENSVPDQRATAFRQADAIMALFDRPAPVVVKPLEWVEDVDGWGAVNLFNTDEFLYIAWPSRWQMTQEPCWELFEAAQTDDDELPIKGACFDELDALKAACQADFARRILSAVNAVSEARVAELEAEVAHLRQVEAGAVRQADELAAMRGVVEAARAFKAEHPVARLDAVVSEARANLDAAINRLDALTKAEG